LVVGAAHADVLDPRHVDCGDAPPKAAQNVRVEVLVGE
jgi:hypothetical protein